MLVVIVYLSEGKNQVIFSLFYVVLFFSLSIGVIFRPFGTRSLNFLRSLVDLVMIGSIAILHISDSTMRKLETMPEEELQKMSEEKILELANY